MKKIKLLALISVGFVFSACSIQIPSSKPEQTNNKQNLSQETNANLNQNTNIDLLVNPKYCQQDSDCIAIPNPSNPCYFAYFNKNANAAIEEFKNSNQIMQQDCPQFSAVYCKENKCTADRK